ncbi:MAG: hypothetical protein IGS48_17380 [Oscillatoriales cyanobacterium C42_A2020_001]|nr:hypothetical protein [Leptolyngbyaceae cyanobacterium C42_A2020_001]
MNSLTQSNTNSQLFQRRPSLVSPGGNAYSEAMTATCVRDRICY